MARVVNRQTSANKTEKLTPVRGDAVRYLDTNTHGWRNAVVLTVTEQEVTFLTVDNDTMTLPLDDVRVVNDSRRISMVELPDSDQSELREQYIQGWIDRVQERAAKEAKTRAAAREEQKKYNNIVPKGEDTVEEPKEQKDSTPSASVGRPKSDKSGVETSITNFIKNAKKWVGKSDILASVTVSVGIYNEVMKNLKENGTIVQTGERRGAKYALANALPEGEEPVRGFKAKVEVDKKIVDKVEKFILKADGPVSRADIAKGCKLSQDQWMAVRVPLMERGKVQMTGAKRGTRYSPVEVEDPTQDS